MDGRAEDRPSTPSLSRDSFMSPIHLSHIFSRAPAATHVNTDLGARVNQCRNIRLRLVRISFMDEIETMDGRVRSGAGGGGALADSMQAELKSLTASCPRPLTLHRHGRVCVPRLNNDGSASELIREVILSEQGRRNMSGGGLTARTRFLFQLPRSSDWRQFHFQAKAASVRSEQVQTAQMHYVAF